MIPKNKFYFDENGLRHKLDGPAYSSINGSLHQWFYHGEPIIEVLLSYLDKKVVVTHFYISPHKEERMDFSMEDGLIYCQKIFDKIIKMRAFL